MKLTFDEAFTVGKTAGNAVKQKDYLPEGKFPVIDQGEDFISGYSDDESLVLDFTKPVIIFGDHTRRLKYVNFPFIPGADGTKILVQSDSMDSKFAYYQLQSKDLRDKGYARHFSELRKEEFWVPPIDEQFKIVELLEDHLSRLDVAMADVKQAKLKAAQFRRALLQAGLNGFFNNETKNNETGLPAKWSVIRLADVADWTSGGTPSSKNSTFYGGDIPWIVIGDLTESLVTDTAKKITKKGLDSSSAKKLPAGTVMVAMYGASIGRTGVMGEEMTTNQAIACGVPKSDKILGQYLLYFLQSQKQEFISAGKGGAQPNISQGVVKSWKIPVPPLEEQKLIIEEIDNQLLHLDKANQGTELMSREAVGLRRSLLQAAFTGQLTNEVASV